MGVIWKCDDSRGSYNGCKDNKYNNKDLSVTITKELTTTYRIITMATLKAIVITVKVIPLSQVTTIIITMS